RYWLAMDFDKEIVLLTENDLIMKDFENLANLLYFSTSLTDKAYENSITEHKAILDAVKKRDFLKVTEALEDHIIKHFLPEARD
ncbi:MAG: FCD domain-containing protein, partial [Firmicutes bacterium]|nr:FCD domain-containing protein [Bacillota bacterium]